MIMDSTLIAITNTISARDASAIIYLMIIIIYARGFASAATKLAANAFGFINHWTEHCKPGEKS
jgi:hypothetical protein